MLAPDFRSNNFTAHTRKRTRVVDSEDRRARSVILGDPRRDSHVSAVANQRIFVLLRFFTTNLFLLRFINYIVIFKFSLQSFKKKVLISVI